MDEITVGEFKELLDGYSDDTVLYFNGLDFYRLKLRGEKFLNVEFNQTIGADPDTGEIVIYSQ